VTISRPSGAGPADFRVPRDQRLVGGGRFELIDVLAAGGMGAVYKARDVRLAVVRAIKMLPGSFAEDSNMRARFEREAQISVGLMHRNVVRTYELIEEPDGRLGIVMDLIEGQELGNLIKSADSQLMPSAREAVRMIGRLLDAVEYVHSRGIVRLDVKPGNVIVDHEGEPVMIDFGVARRLADESSDLTVGGAVIGTPAYMAPEALRGQPIDERSDIFSVGIVLYQLLGGQLRFDSYNETVRRRIMEDVDVSVLRCSPQLREVVAACVARDPDRRFPNAASARATLARVPEAASGA
jgi:serine/threonine-protein kinase